jgi:hypothetical protein
VHVLVNVPVCIPVGQVRRLDKPGRALLICEPADDAKELFDGFWRGLDVYNKT